MSVKHISLFFLAALAFAAEPLHADTATVNGVTWTYVISNGTATIGDGNYCAIPHLTSGALSIPASLGGHPVTSIGDRAFFGCSGLTSVTIPDGVTSIGDVAFYGCSGLTSITIPNSVTSIGESAFYGCFSLASVTIPDGVTRIGELAFGRCSSLTSITIPNSVTNIGDASFESCSGLTSITIPNGVTSIGDRAFSGCSGLTSITIPASVTSSGNGAFYRCSGLTAVHISDLAAWCGVSFGFDSNPLAYAHHLFLNGEEVTELVVPNGVTNIGAYAFYGGTGLTSIMIPDGVTSIGDYAFSGCTGLASITIPDSVTSIGDYAFSGCTGLASATIPDRMTILGNSWFSGCSGLTSITIPDSVTVIGSGVFSGCSGLTSITIPDSVTVIGNAAFEDCSGLMSITIPGSVTNIGSYAFSHCSGLTSITIPDGVTSIEGDAFSRCYRLASVTIPDSVTSIGGAAFYGCSGLTSITIPDRVTSIEYATFSGCSSLMSITIPDSVASIGTAAFYGCSGLASVTIPDSVTSIGKNAFISCTGLVSIAIGNGVTNIGGWAFEDCSGLTSVTIGNGVTNIEEYAFSGCSRLTSVTIGNGVTSIEEHAFYGCSGLTAVHISDLAAWCGASFDIDSNPLVYAHHLFLNGEEVVNLVIPNGVTNIGDRAFSDCSVLASVTIPDSVASIGNAAFYGCSGLASVSIPDGVTNIGASAFSYCSGLMSIAIPDHVTSIGDYSFYGCSGLMSVTIPNGVTNIGARAFDGCSGLTSITIPASVTSGGALVFRGCSELKTLYLPNSYSGSISCPWGCTIVRYDELVSLFVSSPFGVPVPGCGTGIAPSNVLFSCSVPSPVEDGGWRYICTGWRGTGSVPASGTSNRVDVLMLEDSSIEWLWETNVWIECGIAGNAAGGTNGWFRPGGASIVVPFAPEGPLFRTRLEGDDGGVFVDADTRTVSVPSDRPRSVTLCVETVTVANAANAGGKPLDWTGDVNAPWFAVADTTAADGFSLRSGEVDQGETSALETTVTGPGRLSFVWRTNATRSDYARFYVDGTKQFQINRQSTWATNELDIAEGDHVLRWTFERGSAAGGAAFLDDVRWTPLHTLTVASTNGTPTPAAGTHDVYWGTNVAASVAAPAPTAGGKTRRVCTGWTGTGSVPSNGTGTNVAFTVEEDSRLTWNWRTDHWIDVAVVSGGTASFQPQWAAERTTVSVSLSPNWFLYDIALSGDTNGVTVSGSTLRVPADGPRTIRATITERNVSFTVSTPMGEVSPAPGTYEHSYGDTVTATAVSPLSESGGVQVVCAGWTGTGSVSPSGTGTSQSFSIYQDSSIAWTWATNVWIDVTVSGGSTPFSPQWVRKGTIKEIELTPATHLFAITLSGDVADGVELDGTTLRIRADKPRTIRASIAERTIALAVSSAFGTASPAVGTHVHSWGDAVVASVAAPGPDGGTNRVCTGWTGTGSVPASGGTATASFTMEEDSGLAWNWRTDYRISLETDGPVAADFSDGWCTAGGTLAIAYDVLLADGDFTFALGGDTNGVVHDAAARTLAVPCDGARVLSLAVAPVPPEPPEPEPTLESALDAPGLVWTSVGANAWTPQTATAKDGEDAAESGDATGGVGAESVLETTVIGPGTLSWSWKIETAGGSGLDLDVGADDDPERTLDEASGWTEESVQISGTGEHPVRFVFWNDNGSSADRAWIDRVSWSGAVPAAPGSETTTTPAPVPHEWLVAHGLAAAGSSAAAFEAAAEQRGGNGRPAWESYVAGIDPDTEDFTVSIDFSRGFPEVTWSPSNVAGRAYAVWGKTALTDQWTTPTNETHRFFQVRVGLAGDEPDDSFDEPVVVSFDPAGGTVDPGTKTYAKPGTLGALPTPVRDGREFLGWWTRETGGVQADETTAVPWSNWTLHARWLSTIAFDTDGGSAVAPITTTAGAVLTAPAAPTKNGFLFAGWSPAFPATMPEGGATLTAIWVDPAFFTWHVLGDGTVEISGVNGTPTGSLTIPPAIDGRPVTSIGSEAFYCCYELTAVTIPDGVTSIGSEAFEFCNMLASVTIPDGVTDIGSYAFGYSGLTSITIPGSVTSIGEGTFSGCYDLISITILDGVTSIGSGAFAFCYGLTSVTIPDSVTSVGYWAFDDCSSLETISIPASLHGQTSNWGLPSTCRIIVRN